MATTTQTLVRPQSNSPKQRARVFAMHDVQGLGHARLPDGRQVWISTNDLVNSSAQLQLGDIIEFQLEQTARGLTAKRIDIVVESGKKRLHKIPSNTASLTIPELAKEVKDELRREPEPAVGPVQADISTAAASEFYHLAAVARAEGRISDARSLFEKALAAGAAPAFFAAYAKMEMEKGSAQNAANVIDRALRAFPLYPTFYVMHGQMERRSGNLRSAEHILRTGLTHNSQDALLRQGLARVLADLGTTQSLREADRIFQQLDKEGKLNRSDGSYQRFRALQRSPRVANAYMFFDRLPGFKVGITGKRDLPPHITDLVVEVDRPELDASFGLSGAYLVRCFDRQPQKVEINALIKQLRADSSIGLIDREVSISSTLAFVIVPGTGAVRDHFMSVLSANNEALIPLDDQDFSGQRGPMEILRQLLAQFLGSRDLYNSTLPVSGRRFFGRERLLVQLTDQVHRGEFLGIYGLRKMGKTSLIYQLRDEKLRDDAVAYVDLQASSALLLKQMAPVYWELERDLYQRTKTLWPEVSNSLRLGQFERFSDIPDNGKKAALIFSEDLRGILSLIAAKGIGGLRRVVIVLDELERILPIGGQQGAEGYLEFFSILRGLAQTEQFRGVLSSVVVAANSLISEKASWEGRENPVFALYQPVFVPPLSDRDTFHMIRTLGKGMSVYWDDEAMKIAFEEAGGHPFLTRLLCSRIIQRNLKRPLHVTVQVVRASIPNFVKEETDKFLQILELLHTYFPEEEQFLEKLAIDSEVPSVSDGGLSHLLGYQLIASSGNTYRITLNVLKRWLRRRAGMSE